METYTLSNGVAIPKIGFGTWQIPEGEEAYNSVSFALKAGYTHIDTAQIYGNEVSVGKAIADSDMAREDIFLTTNSGMTSTITIWLRPLSTNLSKDWVWIIWIFCSSTGQIQRHFVRMMLGRLVMQVLGRQWKKPTKMVRCVLSVCLTL